MGSKTQFPSRGKHAISRWPVDMPVNNKTTFRVAMARRRRERRRRVCVPEIVSANQLPGERKTPCIDSVPIRSQEFVVRIVLDRQQQQRHGQGARH